MAIRHPLHQISRRLAPMLTSASLLVGLHGSAAAYSTFYVFGDSLSDSGNVLAFTRQPNPIGALLPDLPAPPYFNGRFTNGHNFADVVNGGLFGQPLTPFLLGGTNYAVGGATTGLGNAAVPTGGIVPPTGVLAQVGYYVTAPGFTGADPEALYLVYGGANDLFSLLEAVRLNPLNADALGRSVIENATISYALSLGVLAQAGATNFLLPNLPDLGQTPRYFGTAQQGYASLATQQLNAAFDRVVDAFEQRLLVAVTRLDVYELLNDALAEPADYGFTVLHTACYGGATLGATPAAVCAHPEQHVFWDDIHPTAVAHRALGLAALQALVVPEPGTAVLYVAGLLALGGRFRLRRRSTLMAPPPAQGV